MSEPLPPGTWVVECAKVYQALHVIGPATIELDRGDNVPPTPIRLSEVRAGWWRRSRLRLIDDAGTKTRVRAVPSGSRDLSDVGKPVNGWGSALTSGGDDPLSFIVFLLALVAIIFTFPWMIRRQLRANRVARDLLAAIGPT